MTQRRSFFTLIALALTLLLAPAGSHAADGRYHCANGAWVDAEGRCRLFVVFRQDSQNDWRVQHYLGADAGDVRSIAIVTGISVYPNNTSMNINASHNDVVNLTRFLSDHQQFDEIIVMENQDVTGENLQYFLEQYVPQQSSLYGHRLRVFFAYSGHGLPAGGVVPALALANLRHEHDTANMLSLSALKGELQTASSYSFQLLAMINACYGGGIFDTGWQGDSQFAMGGRSAYVLTAGKEGDLVWTEDSTNGGSIFFDTFINGIEQGRDNPYPAMSFDSDPPVNHGTVVQLGYAIGDISRRVQIIQDGGTPLKIQREQISQPRIGSILPGGASQGSFFFLGGAANTPTPSPVETVGSWDGQGLQNRLGDYALRGIDVSHHNGAVNWRLVLQAGVQFAYVKATDGGRHVDRRFLENMAALHQLAMPHGVYHTYSFCVDPDVQFENLTHIVPVSQEILPTVVDVEWYGTPTPDAPEFIRREAECAQNDTHVSEHLRTLLDRIETTYGKRPILYASNEALQRLFDSTIAAFPRWVADDHSTAVQAGHPRSETPWTLWQYTARGHVPGVEGPVDMNVFAGSRVAFQGFQRGELPAQ